MPFVAPWLLHSDPIHAAAAGASAGAAGRSLDIGESEAANRLQLSYAQLGVQQQENAARTQHAADALKADKALAAANIASTAAWHAEQAGWHQEAANTQRAAEALREKHESFWENLANDKAQKEKSGYEPEIKTVGGIEFVVNPKTGRFERLEKVAKDLDAKSLLQFATQFERLAMNPVTDPTQRSTATQRAKAFYDMARQKNPELPEFTTPQPTNAPPTGTGFELFNARTWFGGGASANPADALRAPPGMPSVAPSRAGVKVLSIRRKGSKATAPADETDQEDQPQQE